MITHFRTFEDINNNTIPNCEIEAGKGVKVDGAFENDSPLWVQLNTVRLIVVVLGDDNLWKAYGAYTWTGAVAVRPDILYNIVSNAAVFPKGVYAVVNFDLKTSPQVSGLYYQEGPFYLKWDKF